MLINYQSGNCPSTIGSKKNSKILFLKKKKLIGDWDKNTVEKQSFRYKLQFSQNPAEIFQNTSSNSVCLLYSSYKLNRRQSVVVQLFPQSFKTLFVIPFLFCFFCLLYSSYKLIEDKMRFNSFLNLLFSVITLCTTKQSSNFLLTSSSSTRFPFFCISSGSIRT